MTPGVLSIIVPFPILQNSGTRLHNPSSTTAFSFHKVMATLFLRSWYCFSVKSITASFLSPLVLHWSRLRLSERPSARRPDVEIRDKAHPSRVPVDSGWSPQSGCFFVPLRRCSTSLESEIKAARDAARGHFSSHRHLRREHRAFFFRLLRENFSASNSNSPTGMTLRP